MGSVHLEMMGQALEGATPMCQQCLHRCDGTSGCPVQSNIALCCETPRRKPLRHRRGPQRQVRCMDARRGKGWTSAHERKCGSVAPRYSSPQVVMWAGCSSKTTTAQPRRDRASVPPGCDRLNVFKWFAAAEASRNTSDAPPIEEPEITCSEPTFGLEQHAQVPSQVPHTSRVLAVSQINTNCGNRTEEHEIKRQRRGCRDV